MEWTESVGGTLCRSIYLIVPYNMSSYPFPSTKNYSTNSLK